MGYVAACFDAVFFDFDGLILNTELPDFIAWQEAFAARGLEFPQTLWEEMIGRSILTISIHPADLIVRELGGGDRQEIIDEHHARRSELIGLETPLPGVVERIDEADRLGLRLAVVSSSDRKWITTHLKAIGLEGRFEAAFCGYEGLPSKPDPALYCAALKHFGLPPDRAFALEDSPNGIAAAKAAGLKCAAVPNVLTTTLDLSHADLRVGNLADTTLEVLMESLA